MMNLEKASAAATPRTALESIALKHSSASGRRNATAIALAGLQRFAVALHLSGLRSAESLSLWPNGALHTTLTSVDDDLIGSSCVPPGGQIALRGPGAMDRSIGRRGPFAIRELFAGAWLRSATQHRLHRHEQNFLPTAVEPLHQLLDERIEARPLHRAQPKCQ